MTLEPHDRPKCDGCAFTAGTEAHQQDTTRLKAYICVHALTPFYCHENVLPDGELPEHDRHLCRGFLNAVRSLASRNYFQELPDWKRKVMAGMLETIDSVEDGKIGADEQALIDELYGNIENALGAMS